MSGTRTLPLVERPAACRAFTLVELLIVITILALLLTMLLPSLDRAREITRQTICMTNLRPVGMAIGYYVEENDGYQVPRHVATPNPFRLWYWSDFLVKYCDDSARPPQSGHGKTSIQPANGIYARERFAYSRLLNCPSQPNRNHSEYAWNMAGGWQQTYDDNNRPKYEPPSGPTLSSVIERPGDFLKVIDAGRLEDHIDWMDGEFTGHAHYQVRAVGRCVVHMGTSNGLMYDGHVEKIERQFILKFADELQYDYWHRMLNAYPFWPRDVRGAQ